MSEYSYDPSSSSDEDNLMEDVLLDVPSSSLGLENESAATEAVESTPESEESPEKPDPTIVMAARAYQREMLEESLKRNIIVAMDTGSGKTHVAVLRIIAELERSEKRVWFLTPTVPLAEQQLGVLQRHIPSVQSKMICGSDNVDSWSNQRIWDAVLSNVRIVVSTYQILFDAVSHAFVQLDSLSLVVFDEAHNCVKKTPAARFMNELYWPARNKKQPVPDILGLTASPVIGSNIDDVETIERTLDAICKTPTRHRDELIAQVNRPTMLTVPHEAAPEQVHSSQYTPSMVSLLKAYRDLDITKDPYILQLQALKTERSRHKLKEAILKRDTFVQRQVKAFWNRSREMRRNLGPWAADYYINKVITSFRARFGRETNQVTQIITDPEKQYMMEVFSGVELNPSVEQPHNLTNKIEVLINVLKSFDGDPVGIVFATERAIVAVLAHVIATHPLTKDRYRVASMVGTSQFSARQDFLNLTVKSDLSSLQQFRVGRKNLLVATSVLEEGIDVPKCNLIICFDPPKSLKSFIQRRGRARMESSQLFLMVSDQSDESATAWNNLEEEMKQKYQDEKREREAIERLEDIEADDSDYPPLRSETTNARLSLQDARSHLQHFCSSISARKFVDWSPFYVVTQTRKESTSSRAPYLLRAVVHLPVSLAPELRRAEGIRDWPSEKQACDDAAFQAYSQLKDAGLLNENLLPLKDSDIFKGFDARPGVLAVREQMNPWVVVAQAWQDGANLHRRRLIVSDQNNVMHTEFELVLPVSIPEMDPLTLYWGPADPKARWTVRLSDDIQMSQSAVDDEMDHTATLFASAFGHRWPTTDKPYLARFVCSDRNLSPDDLCTHDFNLAKMHTTLRGHLVRDMPNARHPYFYVTCLPAKPPVDQVRHPYRGYDEEPVNQPYVVIKNWPHHAGYYHAIEPSPDMESTKLYQRVVPAAQVKVDGMPAKFAQFAMLIPAIMHSLEVRLVAHDLMTKRLETVGLTNLSLVTTAISAPVAREVTNYEKIEFLGDTILKFCATLNCCAQNLNFHEGLLSRVKDRIVSNSRLCKATTDFELDRYIITKGLMHKKWRPKYVQDLLENPPLATDTRVISTKTLADVVEALIGASFLDGGVPMALSCIALLVPLPKSKWQSLHSAREILYQVAVPDLALPKTMAPLEDLLGYTFKKKSLLVEAMTHSSFSGPNVHSCFERLEFLGDAVLDYIVVTEIFALAQKQHPMEHWKMHLLRTVLVNADFLGFLAMEWSVEEDTVNIVTEDDAAGLSTDVTARETIPTQDGTTIELELKKVEHPLWSFMRHGSGELAVLQKATGARFAALRPGIKTAIRDGSHYPWVALARLQSQKFYSDVMESIIGAVFVDSGSLDTVRAVVERAGILQYLRRILRDDVHLLHPKEELGRLAVDKKVEYVVEVGGEGEAEEVVEKEFFCTVAVGGEVLAKVGDGVTREEARARAAEVAVRVLKSRKEGV